MRRTIASMVIASVLLAPSASAATEPASTASVAAMTPPAQTYLDEAMARFRKSHINAAKADWPTLTAKAYKAAGGAKTTSDTYPAIQLIIKELGEKHTVFQDPDTAKAETTGNSAGKATPPPLALPEGAMLANGVGL